MSMQVCTGCGEEVKPYQVLCGVTYEDIRHVGHYECVCDAIGPAGVLKLIRAGHLPMLDTDKMTDHAYPGREVPEAAKEAPKEVPKREKKSASGE